MGQPVSGGVMEFAPVIDRYLKEHLFGAIFSSDILNHQQRELVTISALASMSGTLGQLQSHIGIGMNTGLTENQFNQTFNLIEKYIGKNRQTMQEQYFQKQLENKNMILNEKYTLSNGLEIPKIALGTWFIGDETVAQVVKDAIEIGYRHIDTAQAYGNERGIGEGLKACSIKREDLFITTKLAAEVKSYNDAVASIANSLKLLGLDYIDLMIIHSPKHLGSL